MKSDIEKQNIPKNLMEFDHVSIFV